MLQQNNHKGITLVLSCGERFAFRFGSNEIKALSRSRPIQTNRCNNQIHNSSLSNAVQGVVISSRKWVLLMASALKDNGSTSKWRKIRQRILQRDSYTCQMCGGEGNSVDHIVPRLAGGGDDDWNLQALCGKCNSGKGGRFFYSTPTPLTLSCPDLPQNDSRSLENE